MHRLEKNIVEKGQEERNEPGKNQPGMRIRVVGMETKRRESSNFIFSFTSHSAH